MLLVAVKWESQSGFKEKLAWRNKRGDFSKFRRLVLDSLPLCLPEKPSEITV
jgi:hypothetical protein